MGKIPTGVTFKIDQYLVGEEFGRAAYFSDYHRAVRYSRTILGPRTEFKVGAAFSHDQYGNVVQLVARE